jgi:hypothetical protein
MRTFIGATTLVLLGLSPWILPSIAVAAAKMTREEARSACRSALAQGGLDERGHAHGDGRARHWQAMQDCIDAKLSGWKWPWQ